MLAPISSRVDPEQPRHNFSRPEGPVVTNILMQGRNVAVNPKGQSREQRQKEMAIEWITVGSQRQGGLYSKYKTRAGRMAQGFVALADKLVV